MIITANIIQHKHLCGKEGNRSRRMLSCFEDRWEVYCIVHMVLEDRRIHLTSYRMRGGVFKRRTNYKQTSAWVKHDFESKYLIV
jgi:hypothetical protein